MRAAGRDRRRGRAWSGGQPEVPVVGGQGRPYGVWPAEPLKPGWDLAVVEIQVVAAVAADELEQPSAAVWAGCPRTRGWRRRTAIRPWPSWPGGTAGAAAAPVPGCWP